MAEPASVPYRRCYANDTQDRIEPQDFAPNVIITSKYTPWNFVPKFLFEQFTRFVNAYFLVVCVLQAIPAISLTQGVPTQAFALGFVLFFDGVVTAREDYKRHQGDNAANSRTTLVLRDGKFTQVPWHSIVVGDIVQVLRGEEFPADVVFLASGGSADDEWQRTTCYVQTTQLDGETNLKMRRTTNPSAVFFAEDSSYATFKGRVECEEPTEHFGKFAGVLRYSDDADGDADNLNADQTLLRGCVLRNTPWVFGLVVYTGDQTKVRVKQQLVTLKKASVEAIVNANALYLVLVLVLICTVGGTGQTLFQAGEGSDHYYLDLEDPSVMGFITTFFTYFLLNASFIPVSLARSFQKLFMEVDNALVYKPEGPNGPRYPLKVLSMDLNDELGEISHIFSDKTGTLTKNYMVFRKLCVNGVAYGMGSTQIGIARREREGASPEEIAALRQLAIDAQRNGLAIPHVNFIDGCEEDPGRTLEKDITSSDPYHQEMLKLLFLQLALNHTVVPERIRDADGNITGTNMSASSPDEEAFVYAAQRFGYKFTGRSADEVLLTVNNEPQRFQIVTVLAYSQMRKMMSVIVKNAEGKLYLFSKGADTKILSRVSPTGDAKIQKATEDFLVEWGQDGLRTLMFAYKELGPAEFASWFQVYEAALRDADASGKHDRHEYPNAIDDAMDAIERDLVLLGATANEDELQDGVPEAIATLADTGIKIWMLTGDKQETATNIGFATQMLNTEMELFTLTSEAEPDMSVIVQSAVTKAKEIEKNTEESDNVGSKPLALIIDEAAIDAVLKESSSALVSITQACQAVVCCRCRPDQKAAIVRMIKTHVPEARTLAVGDGANDVDMILESHVGVGIAGAEGQQAAGAADYSIAQFRFLKRLLMVHGRFNYHRICLMVCYIFYKDIVYNFAQVWWSMFTPLSGSKFYVELANVSVNVLYTGLPILLVSVLDRDVDPEWNAKFPFLYNDGLKRLRLTSPIFWSWIGEAFLSSLFLYFVAHLSLWIGDEDGATPHVFALGFTVFANYLVTVTMRLVMEVNRHDVLFVGGTLGSWILYIATSFLFDVWDSDGTRGMVWRMFSLPGFYFVVILSSALALAPKYLVKAVARFFYPKYRNLVREVALLLSGEDRETATRHLLEYPHLMALHDMQAVAEKKGIADHLLRGGLDGLNRNWARRLLHRVKHMSMFSHDDVPATEDDSSMLSPQYVRRIMPVIAAQRQAKSMKVLKSNPRSPAVNPVGPATLYPNVEAKADAPPAVAEVEAAEEGVPSVVKLTDWTHGPTAAQRWRTLRLAVRMGVIMTGSCFSDDETASTVFHGHFTTIGRLLHGRVVGTDRTEELDRLRSGAPGEFSPSPLHGPSE